MNSWPESTQRKATDEMATKKIETRVTNCDLCGSVCEPVREISIYLGGSNDVRNTLELRIFANLPYGTSDGDVCRDCLDKHRERILAALNWETKGGDAETARLREELEATEASHSDEEAAHAESLDEIAAKDAEIERLRAALLVLSKLGNGELPGNSTGNVIAQRALRGEPL
jgi:hypothetical protein